MIDRSVLKPAWKEVKIEAEQKNRLHIVALSGGKDSTAMALRLRELYPERKFRYIITPTGDELPEMQVHWEKLEKILGKIEVITGKTLFERIEKEKMLPNFRARWCTRKLKIEPMIDFLDDLPENSVMYVGLRHDEPGRFGLSSLDKKFVVAYPLRDWEWGLTEVMNYLDRKRIIIPARTDCGCCFYQRLGEWKNLLVKYPERYEKYVRLEKKIGHTFRSPGRDTWPAALEELRKEFNSGRKIRKFTPRAGGDSTQKCRFCSM